MSVLEAATEAANRILHGDTNPDDIQLVAGELLELSARLAQHQKAWKLLSAAIREAEQFDAQHGLHIPGDSALAVVLGGIEENAVRIGDPDEYHRIMSRGERDG